MWRTAISETNAHIIFSQGLPWWLRGKELACNAGNPGSIPGWGRSPGVGNGHPLQYSCLENPMDRGVWWATVHGLTWVRVGHDWAQHTCNTHYITYIVYIYIHIAIYIIFKADSTPASTAPITVERVIVRAPSPEGILTPPHSDLWLPLAHCWHSHLHAWIPKIHLYQLTTKTNNVASSLSALTITFTLSDHMNFSSERFATIPLVPTLIWPI